MDVMLVFNIIQSLIPVKQFQFLFLPVNQATFITLLTDNVNLFLLIVHLDHTITLNLVNVRVVPLDMFTIQQPKCVKDH